MKKTILALACVLFTAPAFAGETANADIAQSDIRKGDEPYVVVQWTDAEDDAGRTGNAQFEPENTLVD